MNPTDSKRRIIIFGNSADSMTNFRGPLIKYLVECGWRVFCIAPGFDNTSRALIRSFGGEPIAIEMSRSGTNPFSEIGVLFKLFRIIRKIRPDALLSYFIKPAVYGAICGWLTRIRSNVALLEGLGYAFEVEADAGYRKKCFQFLVSLLLRTSLSRSSQILVLNADDQRTLLNLKIGDTNKVRNIGGIGVNLNDYSFKPMPPGPPIFLLAARMIREKGVADFARAAQIAKVQRPDFQFVLLGDTDANPNSLSKQELQGWKDRGILDWPGSVSDVRPWLERASVFVLPSYYREGVPRSIQEAMAVGRPIITTDSVGCRDTVEHGVNGFLVPPRSPESLAEAMLQIAADPDEMAAMGLASRAIAETRYNAETFNERLIGFIAV